MTAELQFPKPRRQLLNDDILKSKKQKSRKKISIDKDPHYHQPSNSKTKQKAKQINPEEDVVFTTL